MKVRRIRRQERPPSEAVLVCYEAYQVVGSLLSDLGMFDTPEAERILDNLSQARLVHKNVLPWKPIDRPTGRAFTTPDELFKAIGLPLREPWIDGNGVARPGVLPDDACLTCEGAGEFESALHCEKCPDCDGTGKVR